MFMIIAMAVCQVSCTDNEKAKNYGGTIEYTLDAGQKFVNATWKDDNLWIISEQRSDTVAPRTITMTEKSSYGIYEGKVIIHEK